MVPRVRGIRVVSAMARPRRSKAERAAVIAALDAMPDELSVRSRSRLLAKRVVAQLLAMSDPLDVALTRTRASLGQDPVSILASDPDIALFDDMARLRIERFRARNCQQLDRDAWKIETQGIADQLEARFTERFRRAAR